MEKIVKSYFYLNPQMRVTSRVGLNLNFEFESAREFLMNLNFVFSKSMNLNFIFSKSMNLNLNFVFSTSMNLNV